MSIDMSQFYQVFFDETAEHLATMESLLLGLDVDTPDADRLNAIFRAAHSIKGGSGTFGFTDLSNVTHILETLLDRLRKNEIAITRDMVETFLQAGDVLKALLEAHQNGLVADESATREICSRLELLAGSATGNDKRVVDGSRAEAGESVQHNYQINLHKNSAAFPTKDQFDNLLEDLASIGEIKSRKIAGNEAELLLATYASEAELREIFLFFVQPDQLAIQTLEDSASKGENSSYGIYDQPENIAAATDKAADDGYGFFAEAEEIKSGLDDAQGYGFFEELKDDDRQPADSDRQNTQASVQTAKEDVPNRRAEDRIAVNRRATDVVAGAEASIRVSVSKVDKMINLVGELVITQAMLAETASHMDQVLHERLINGLTQLERNSRDLQDAVMSVRMMPINLVFSRFQRMVYDIANKLGKKVQLKIIGEGTELDKGLIEKISDPLNHLVRNSLDHGIESPETRIARGKDPLGTITLKAAHQGGNVVIEVLDDGAGLNRESILAKAREKGMPVSDSMSDSEVWQLIYAPGFSTATVVTDVSGRGVGMDVVKKNIESIGGRVEVTSRFGQGSTITIRLPLTLAILDGMSIAVGDHIYIIPLSFIIESFQPKVGDINGISGKQGQLVHVRGEYLPLIELYKVFNVQTRITNPTEGILVLLETEGRKFALFVDELVGQHQVVIKSLETNYRKVPGVSGATIMGDGRVALIMDVSALVKLAQQ